MKIFKYILLFCLLYYCYTVYAQDLINNGDFENKLNSWKEEFLKPGTTFVSTTEKTYKGTSSLKISSSVPNDARMVQVVSVIPNAYYNFSGWIYTDIDLKNNPSAACICIMDDYSSISGINKINEWVYTEYCFKTQPNQTNITIAARLGRWGTVIKGTAYFDELKLEKLKDPPNHYQKLKNYSQNKDLSPFLILIPIIVLLGIMAFLLRKNSN